MSAGGRPELLGLRPSMTGTCGHSSDGGATECGLPAVLHGLVNTDPGDQVTACLEHGPQLKAISADWHEIGPVCEVPGSTWQVGMLIPGTGFCFWNAAEELASAQLLELQDSASAHA